jgi:hypothetical protein
MTERIPGRRRSGTSKAPSGNLGHAVAVAVDPDEGTSLLARVVASRAEKANESCMIWCKWD